MGNLHAAEMAGMVEDGAVNLDVALGWHLTSNHYPPLPAGLVPVARRVIDAANAGQWDADVDLPAGITWRGQDTAPVSACVEAWHLDAFLDGGYVDDEELEGDDLDYLGGDYVARQPLANGEE